MIREIIRDHLHVVSNWTQEQDSADQSEQHTSDHFESGAGHNDALVRDALVDLRYSWEEGSVTAHDTYSDAGQAAESRYAEGSSSESSSEGSTTEVGTHSAKAILTWASYVATFPQPSTWPFEDHLFDRLLIRELANVCSMFLGRPALPESEDAQALRAQWRLGPDGAMQCSLSGCEVTSMDPEELAAHLLEEHVAWYAPIPSTDQSLKALLVAHHPVHHRKLTVTSTRPLRWILPPVSILTRPSWNLSLSYLKVSALHHVHLTVVY